MSLPDLSALCIGHTLFDYLAGSGGGKEDCNFHEDEIVPPEHRDNPDYDPPISKEQNCATEGYLMYKPTHRGVDRVQYNSTSFKDKAIAVTISAETGAHVITLQPLLGRSAGKTARIERFESEHRQWIDTVFPVTCKRPNGLLDIRWKGYGEDLLTQSDWYYLDPKGEGHLFVSSSYNKTTRKILKLPEPPVGCFKGNLIYIVLVCAKAGTGVGKTMLSVADAVASKIGADGIALSTLSNSAGVYFNHGYEFVSKSNGMPIDVAEWVEERVQPGGKVKRFLNTTKPHTPRGHKRNASEDVKHLYEEIHGHHVSHNLSYYLV